MLSFNGFERADFPKDFLWGAATSAYQVEGGNTKNQWHRWEQEPGKIENGDRCGRSANQYELYEKDFDLAVELRHNTHRLGIEWSRLCPDSPDRFDEKEITHYRKVLEALKERGLTVFLTLHHFTEPLWFFDRGSFTREGAEHDFARYVGRVAKDLGDLVDFWITFNEPQVGIMGTLWGEFPPEKTDMVWTARECAGRLRGHAAARAAIKTHRPDAEVGYVNSVCEMAPHRTRDFLDTTYAGLHDYLWNHVWLEAPTTGWISLPAGGRDVYLPELENSCDWWGVNFYTNLRVDSRNPRGSRDALEGERVSQMGWTWQPEGLYRALQRYSALNKPMYVTENGIGTLDDLERVRFIADHLRMVSLAIKDGMDIRGYLYWSLIDNFEWACGFRPRFGLVEVNYETFERRVKPSGRFLGEIIGNNALTMELVEKYLPERCRF